MNAHAGKPFYGMLQFAVSAKSADYWSLTKGNSPFGAWVVCVYRVEASLEPRVGKCNDLRLFCILTKIGEVLCWAGADSIGVNNGDCYGV